MLAEVWIFGVQSDISSLQRESMGCDHARSTVRSGILRRNLAETVNKFSPIPWKIVFTPSVPRTYVVDYIC